MQMIESMLKEFNEEATTTRRVLAHVPDDRLSWRPHERSMSLGQLAIHIATVPGALARITQQESFDVSQGSFVPPQPASLDEIEAALEESIAQVRAMLGAATEECAATAWHLKLGKQEMMCRPRMEVWRSIMLNHWYHHRGQLSVYLRLLDVPVPSIYGPSADESPFGPQ